MRLARFDSRRFQVDIPRPYSIRSAQKTWERAGLFSELAASGAGTVTIGLHAGARSLFLFMESSAQTPSAGFAGYADLHVVRLWSPDSGGNGVPVILLHANTGNADSWQDNIAGFVEAGYRVITFDRPGVGASDAEQHNS